MFAIHCRTSCHASCHSPPLSTPSLASASLTTRSMKPRSYRRLAATRTSSLSSSSASETSTPRRGARVIVCSETHTLRNDRKLHAVHAYRWSTSCIGWRRCASARATIEDAKRTRRRRDVDSRSLQLGRRCSTNDDISIIVCRCRSCRHTCRCRHSLGFNNHTKQQQRKQHNEVVLTRALLSDLTLRS